MIPKQTPWSATPPLEGGHVGYILDDKGIVLSCDANYAMNKFQYVRQPSNLLNIGYSYACNPFPGQSGDKIATMRTNTIPALEGEVFGLESLLVDCNNRPIIGFKLKTTDDKLNYYYEYQCGNQTLAKIETKSTPFNDSNFTGVAQTYNLDRHIIDCSNKFLTAFNLRTTDDLTQYRYEYSCGENVPQIIENFTMGSGSETETNFWSNWGGFSAIITIIILILIVAMFVKKVRCGK